MAAAQADTVDDVTTTRETEVKNTSGYADNWQHERTITESLRYSLKENILCDVTFIVGEGRTRIQAHKLILSLRSCVFHSMLTGDLKEQGDIVIPDTEAEIFHLFLEFLYTDETNFKPKNVIQLLYLARKYGVTNLEKRCLNYLETEMTTVDACLLLEETHIYKQDDVSVTCLRYIWKNGEAVLNLESFTDLCRECLGKIIEPDDLNATEETLFQSCMKWSEAECKRQGKEITAENQREMLGKELYLIRFPLLDSKFFQNKVLPKDILIDSEKFETVSLYVYPENDVSLFSKRRRVGTKKKLIKIDRFTNVHLNNVIKYYTSLYDVTEFSLDRSAALKGFSILSVIEKNSSVTIKASVCEVSKDVMVQGSSVDKTINLNSLDIHFTSPLELKKKTKYKLIVQTVGGVTYHTDVRQGEIREGFLKCTFSDYKSCFHIPTSKQVKTNLISRLKFLV